MYELHIANRNYSSWSLRPWVLMRELGIAFVEHVNVFAEASNWKAFRRFSPTGRVPCLHDGDLVVWDSLAITEYLAERHAGVWPGDRASRAWARAASAEMHAGFSALRNCCSMSCGVRIRLASVPPELTRDIQRLDELWCEGLARHGGPFLAGPDFTAVDAFYAPVAFRIQTYDLALGPEARAYAARLLALPAMQAWYQGALTETWRDSAHEADIMASGEVLADYRSPPLAAS